MTRVQQMLLRGDFLLTAECRRAGADRVKTDVAGLRGAFSVSPPVSSAFVRQTRCGFYA